MRIFIFLVVACGAVTNSVAQDDLFCYEDVMGNCDSEQKEITCSSSIGSFEDLSSSWSELANDNLAKNFEYLKLYIHFSSFLMHRPGFAALFRALADYKWDLAQNTIGFITEKGGEMEFCQPCVCSVSYCEVDSCSCEDSCDFCSVSRSHYRRVVVEEDVEGNEDGYEIGELLSLALAIDNEKRTCLQADEIHRLSVSANTHDVQSAYYSIRDYLRPHRKILRNLVAYENELAQMLTHKDQAISFYKMDDYIYACDVFD